MLEAALVLVRLAQYAGAMTLFGSSLFFFYALPRAGPASAASLGWPRRLLLVGAGLTLAGAVVGLVLQTAVMAGSLTEALKPASLGFMISGTGIGLASIVRAAAGGLGLVALLRVPPGRGLWVSAGVLGGLACGSLGWMGHGAATDGPSGLVHLVGDIAHALGAAAWLGALAAFLILLWLPTPASLEHLRALLGALRRFSAIGTALVATVVVSGLVNGWFLVGVDRLAGLWTTTYGRLLVAKLLVFVLMLALAAANRFRLTPALGAALESDRRPVQSVAKLKSSLLLEAAGGVVILVLVAWLGTLAPVSAQ